jgi:hypothetical protein
MRLADDEITIRLKGEEIRLRPTLRAAYRLERRYSGFDKLIRAVADGNLAAMADVIGESSKRSSSLLDILERLGTTPLQSGIEVLTSPIISHVFALAGVDPKAKPESPGGARITFAEFHERLFAIATGWLGWTPDTAWNATPAEILAAHGGRFDMLKAIFGSPKKDDKPQDGPIVHTEEEIQESLAFLRTLRSA